MSGRSSTPSRHRPQRSRAGARPRPARGRRPSRSTRSRRGWRRLLPLAGAVLAIVLAALVVANLDRFQEAIREVTLPLRHEDVIRQESRQWDVPADLVAAVIYRESRFRDQTSSAGARGLMQITPRTAKLIERESGGTTFTQEDLANPDVNIAYGTFYLRLLLDKFEQNQIAALAAYNAGETNVANWGGSSLKLDEIEFPETRDYIEDVLEKRGDYRDHYGEELGLGG